MARDRLRILFVSQMPPSPPRFGAQARMHGLMAALARRNDLTALSLVDDEFDLAECDREMRKYCEQVVLLPNPAGKDGLLKRTLQLRSLASWHSYERLRYSVPGMQAKLDELLRAKEYDVVNVEFPYLGHFTYRIAPQGSPKPALVVDSHEIAYDMVRQFARKSGGLLRRAYAELDWRKLRREEIAAYRSADGIAACSGADADRIRAHIPSARVVVIPNAADIEFYQPRPGDPPPDANTVVFFGLMSTFPNVDGVTYLAQEIWPKVLARRPQAKLKVIGKNPPPAIRALASPSIEIVGFVEDLRPHLASAAALLVPLRIGGGTRLKIVEGMAMQRPIVSTTLGAEGIEAVPGQDILIADDAEKFASEVVRLMEDPALGARVGEAGRRVSVSKYAWTVAADALEKLYRELLAQRRS